MNPITPWLDPEEVKRLAARLLSQPEQPVEGDLESPGFGAGFVGFVAEFGSGGECSACAVAGTVGSVAPDFAPQPEESAPEESLPEEPVPEESVAEEPVAEEPVPEEPLPEEPLPEEPLPEEPLLEAPVHEESVPEPAAADPQPEARAEEPLPVVPPPPSPVVVPPSTAAEPVVQKADPVPSSPVPSGPFLARMGRFRDWLRQYFDASGIFILDREGAVIFDESQHGRLHFLARSLALTTRRPGNPSANVHVKIGTSATLEVIPVETPYGWFVLGAVVPEPMAPAAVALITEALVRASSPPAAPVGR